MTKIWNKFSFKGRRICMLMITHTCNLNCTYCYETYKSEKKMSFELAKELILKECHFVLNSPDYHEIEIDLMGGEPMMNFPLIKSLVEWAADNPLPVPWVFFLTTNGTLFDDEKKSWFKKYRKFITAAVSYDGSAEMQAQNRKTDQDNIDLSFFHETWPWQSFHMTISKETLPYIASGILAAQKLGYFLEISLAQGVPWSDEDSLIYKEQLEILSNSYIHDPTLEPVNLLTRPIDIKKSNDIFNYRQKRWCGSGTHMITYDVDGQAYGCHLFTPVVLGGKALKRDHINWTCTEISEDSFCKECILKMSCPTCIGFNFRFRNDISKRDHNWCKMVLVEKIVACEFQIKILVARKKTLSDDDAMYAQRALQAYEILKFFESDSCNSPFTFYSTHINTKIERIENENH